MKNLPGGDALDFNEGASREGLDGEGAAGRERSGEELGVDLVHGGEIAHVGKEYRRLDDARKAEAGRFEDGPRVEQGLAGLLLDAALREGTRGGIDGELTGNENEAVAAVDSLAVRADGGRCFFSVDRFHSILKG